MLPRTFTARLLATAPALALAGLFTFSPMASGHVTSDSDSPATSGGVASHPVSMSVLNTAMAGPLSPGEATEYLAVDTPPQPPRPQPPIGYPTGKGKANPCFPNARGSCDQ
jgi:hypothetical protein